MNLSDNMAQFMHLPGFRFSPTDQELVDCLKLKMIGQDHEVNQIAEVNIYSFEPWELPGKSVIKPDTPEWYFFVPRIRYGKSQRCSRTTKSGYWKVTGEPRKVVMGREVIATKKSMVFYKGRTPNGVKTNWIIHEYALPNQKEEYVVCKLKGGPDDVQTDESFASDQFSSNVDVGYGQYYSSYDQTGGETSNYRDGCAGFNPTYGNTSNYAPQDDDQLQLEAHLNAFGSCNEMEFNLDYAMSYNYNQ